MEENNEKFRFYILISVALQAALLLFNANIYDLSNLVGYFLLYIVMFFCLLLFNLIILTVLNLMDKNPKINVITVLLTPTITFVVCLLVKFINA